MHLWEQTDYSRALFFQIRKLTLQPICRYSNGVLIDIHSKLTGCLAKKAGQQEEGKGEALGLEPP